MKKEMADAWVAALRSGKYVQTKGALRRRNKYVGVRPQATGYCCLGVLCEINGAEEDEDRNAYLSYFNLPGTKDSSSSLLTPSMGEAWGLSSLDPRVPADDWLRAFLIDHNYFTTSMGANLWASIPLSHLNDFGLGFPEIATLIERYWEVL